MASLIPIADDPEKVVVRGEVRRIRLGFKYCSCGRPADFICDWKTNSPSGTCDLAVCSRCVLQVGPDKHLCEYDQKAFEHWKKRHPEKLPYVAEQLRLEI